MNRKTNLRLALALALAWAAPAVASPGAARAQHLAAILDSQGRVVYVNAPEVCSPAFAIPIGRIGSREILLDVQQASERLQLDPDLLHAIIRVESDYNPLAVSPKGAEGLMQLIPATAARFGVHNPFNPKENIEGGAAYLSYLLKLFSGDLPRSLAAYNAGEHAVLRAGRRNDPIPRIPDTQAYVRKVTAAYAQGPAVHAMESGQIPKTRSLKPEIYSFVDTQGVVHFEQ